ncbi:MAG: site-specific integrase [Candidatus Eisenbacteria bacterium]
MLIKFFPRVHDRYSSLALIGPRLDAFTSWLQSEGYPPLSIKLRVRATARLEALLAAQAVRRLEDLSAKELLEFAPEDSQEDIYLAATVRSLTRWLDAEGVLAKTVETPARQLVAEYLSHLDRVRGFAESTCAHHGATAAEFLGVVGFDGDPVVLQRLGSHEIETFIRAVGGRVGRGNLQHKVACLRSFLRFLAELGQIVPGLDALIDTPRTYRGERLPRALPWSTVQAFLKAIDLSSPKGRRDYAMFLLIATYGLRTSEVAALRLDDIEWRQDRIRIPRPKTRSPLVLPLTTEIGAALIDYLTHGRPELPYRQVFLRVRAPEGPLGRTGVTSAFQAWTRRGGLPIPYHGPHCLRHSLAVHLLRQGTSLKAIGDLLGHRSTESTCVYLRLHVGDLREAALALPKEARR